jgi:hypothetical protein
MTTLKATSPKTASRTVKHFDIRLRKIRSFKTSALKSSLPKSASPKIVVAAVRTHGNKSVLKSIVPYGLVVASLTFGTAATASEAHAKAAKHVAPAHAITHVARHAAPAQQPDFVAQFFQGLFGGGAPVKVSGGSAAESTATPDRVDTVDSASAATDAQAASDAELLANQQMNDEMALNASMQAAEQQNEAAQAAAIQAQQN